MRKDLVCVALTRPDAADPFSIVLIHEEGLTQPWTRVDVRRTIVSISTGRLDPDAQPCFVALSDEGDVYFLQDGGPAREKIPGAGIYSSDADGRGAVARIYGSSDEALLVIGQRGQVFRRNGPNNWRQLAPSLRRSRFRAIS